MEKTSNKKYPFRWQVIAVFSWLYVIIKLFIFDIDNFIVHKLFPNSEDVLNYKFIFILFILAILWLLLNKRFLLFWYYILTYPFRLLIKFIILVIVVVAGSGSSVIFGAIASVIVAIKSAKEWFVGSVFFISACLLILLNLGSLAKITAMIFLLGYLLRHHFHRYYYAFKPESVLRSINESLRDNWTMNKNNIIIRDLYDTSKYPEGSDAYIKKKTESVRTLIILNGLFRSAAYKLKAFHESRILMVYAILKLVHTFTLTVVVFAFVYDALYLIRPDSFLINGSVNFFSYLYYSFNKILFSSIVEITPVASLSKLLSSLEMIFGISMVLIMSSLLTTIIREKSEEELKDLIKQIESESENLKNFLIAEFAQSPNEIDDQYELFVNSMKNILPKKAEIENK